MVDNTRLNPGEGGDVIAADDVNGVKFQRVKLTLGGDGQDQGDVHDGNPLPVIDAFVAGSWAYLTGVAGDVQLPPLSRVLSISAVTGMSAGSVAVAGGPPIALPAGFALTLEPRGTLEAPAVSFANTLSYLIEYVV
jgi:hypothetical protein